MLCLLTSLMCLLGSIVWHFTLRMLSISVPHIPNNAELLPGTTKHLHSLFLFLCLTVTLHTPRFFIFYLLYVHNMTLLSLYFARCSNSALGNSILSISNGIILSLPPISYFIFMFCFFNLLPVSKFAIILYIMLLKLRNVIFTMSICQSLSVF